MHYALAEAGKNISVVAENNYGTGRMNYKIKNDIILKNFQKN